MDENDFAVVEGRSKSLLGIRFPLFPLGVRLKLGGDRFRAPPRRIAVEEVPRNQKTHQADGRRRADRVPQQRPLPFRTKFTVAHGMSSLQR